MSEINAPQQVLAGNTIRLSVLITDISGVGTNVTSTSGTIYDSSGTAVQTGIALINASTTPGNYYYDYTLPSTAPKGKWTFDVYASLGGNVGRGKMYFTVID